MADPPGQGLRGLADQVARGAAEDEEARRIPGAVDEHAQEREQLRGTLDLVDDDQPAQPLQGQLGLGQGREVGRVFQVEAGDRGVGQAVGVHACQRGLAALPRAEQRDHRRNREAGLDLRQVSVAFHTRIFGDRSRNIKDKVRQIGLLNRGDAGRGCDHVRRREGSRDRPRICKDARAVAFWGDPWPHRHFG